MAASDKLPEKTGRPLNGIRAYIAVAMQGDETIEARQPLLVKQRPAVTAQMAELQKTMG